MRKWVVHEVLADAAYQNPLVEVVSGGHRYTYAQEYERVLRLANSLHRLGIAQGTVVGVMDVNSHRYLELKYALSMLGAVIHTINFRLPAEDLVYTIQHAKDEWLFLWAGFGDGAVRLASLFPQVVWLEDDDGEDIPANHALVFEELVATGQKLEPSQAPRVEETDPYSIFYTTGTTGRPKGLLYRHRDMLTASLQIAHHLAIHDTGARVDAESVVMPLIPFFHIHGWGTPFFAPYLGAKLVLPERANAKEQLELIRQEAVTWSNMVPTQLQILLTEVSAQMEQRPHAPPLGGNKEPERERLVLHVLTGGSPLSTGLAERATEAGVTYALIYGGSDQLGTSITTAAGLTGIQRLSRLATRMTPLPMVRVEVRDGNNQLVPWDGESLGELWVQSPWLPTGYLQDTERSRGVYVDGWFRSGDLAVRYPDGSFYVADRVKDAVKSGGEWIATSVIEAMLSEMPGVQAAAVVAAPDERWGERPVAVVQADFRVEEAAVRAHLQAAVTSGRLAKFWVPDRIEFVTALPITSAGKIHKVQLRQNLGLTSQESL
ncbi:AMP-dependent synthetase [Alicyclobacillaceae bacterium I2511]|nr:AMP-dependent synthetase [Alicyclobacillaceae bacterium I2511]